MSPPQADGQSPGMSHHAASKIDDPKAHRFQPFTHPLSAQNQPLHRRVQIECQHRYRPPRGVGSKTLPAAVTSSPSPDESPARPAASPCIFPSAGPGKPNSVAPWPDCEPFHSRLDGAVGDRATHRTTECPRKLAPPWSASGSFRVLCPHLAPRAHRRPPSAPPRAPAGRPATSRLPESSPDNRACNSLTPFRCPHAVHLYESVDSGLAEVPQTRVPV